MGNQQSVGKNDIAMPPLFYDYRKVPRSAFRLADMVLGPTTEEVTEDYIRGVHQTVPRNKVVTADDLVVDWNKRRVFKPRVSIEIFQVISSDPNCKLHANQMTVDLGIGEFSFLRCMMAATNFSIEHDPDLKALDGTPLHLEVRYYHLDGDLISMMPNTANFILHGNIYGMMNGATGKREVPLFDVIKAPGDLVDESQIAAIVEAERLKKQGEIDELIAADIFTYELPL